MTGHLFRKAFLFISVALLHAGFLRADEVVWANPGTGSYSDGNNWVGGFAPQGWQSILIGNGGTAQIEYDTPVSNVTISNNSTLQLLSSNQSYLGSNEVYLGQVGTGTLLIDNLAIAATGDFYAGAGVSSTGILSIDGGTLSPFRFYAGYYGNATVSMTNGSTLESTNGYVGNFAGSFGVVTMQDSTWTASSEGQPLNITVGVAGSGQINATNSQISSQNLVLGSEVGSTGNISASGGTITVEEYTQIGSNGTGSLSLSNSAVLSTYGLSVALADGSTGSLSITGSTLNSTTDVHIGLGGDGTLVGNNAQINAPTLFISRNASATGNATISGGLVNLTHDLHVGSTGTGSLTLENGAILQSDIGNIGFEAGAVGVMNIVDSEWTNTRAVFVGVHGNGTVNMSAEGGIASESGYLAQEATGVALVNVNGGSWMMQNTLAVGVNGTAQLYVTNGGEVGSEWSQVSLNAGSSGMVSLNNGTWSTNQTLTIGALSGGSVTATNGSVLSAQAIQMGQQQGVTASLTVTNSTVSIVNLLSTSSNATAEFSGVQLNLRGGSSVLDTLLISGFNPGAFVIGSGGITVDTQGGNARIPQQLAGPGGLTKTGAGRLRLTGSNSYGGGTSVQGGVLEIEGSGALADGNVVLGSAELRSSANATLAGDLNGGIQLVSVSGNQTGVLSAVNGTTLTMAPMDFLLVSGSTLQIGSAGNTGTVIFGPTGAVALPVDVALNVVAGTFLAANNALQDITSIANSTTVAAGATLDFADFLSVNGGIQALYGAGTVQTGTLSATQLVVNSGNFSGNIAGNGSLVKESAGTLILSGQTSFIGGTTVNAGTLIVNGSLAEGLGNVLVNSGGTLGGSGLMNGISLNGGDLSPGNSSGNLTAGELLWTSGTVLFDLGASPGQSDFISIGSFEGLAAPGDFYEFTFLDNGWVEGTIYTLIDFQYSTFNNDASQFVFTNTGGFDGTFFFEDDALKFTLTTIPEPSSLPLLAVGAALAALLRRQRKVRSGQS